ncbi:MAG TPA: hypothetical protein VHE61_07375 [Opitutaceae bacterium]|nr:hypothetical protein [Opitutaceae bacterium]
MISPDPHIDDLYRALDRAVNLKTFLKADHRVAKVAAFLSKHFRENAQPLGYKGPGKSMVVESLRNGQRTFLFGPDEKSDANSMQQPGA